MFLTVVAAGVFLAPAGATTVSQPTGASGQTIVTAGLGETNAITIVRTFGGDFLVSEAVGAVTLSGAPGCGVVSPNSVQCGGASIDVRITLGDLDDSLTVMDAVYGVFVDGGEGADTITGGTGVDTIIGGTGDDVLTGAVGNDTIDGGIGTDRIVETASMNITLTDSALTIPTSGTDVLSSIELATLTGSDFGDVIDASGFSGQTILNGQGGSDTLIGGSSFDVVNGGDGADSLSGGALNDQLNGGNSNDTLNGGPGADQMDGGPGDDVLDGGADTADDLLLGGGGNDRVVASTDGNLTVSALLVLTGNGSDQLSGIQNLTLTGGPGPNVLDASAFGVGPVILDGGGGNDTLLGGFLDDTLTGGPGIDTFNAGEGDDQLDARDGKTEKSIVCGAGTDTALVDPADRTNVDCETSDGMDVAAPNTRLLKGPKAKTTSRTAKFKFRSTEAGSKFQCKLDRGKYKACKSPRTYRKLKKGKHTFQVRAIDAAGNVDATPVKKVWRVR